MRPLRLWLLATVAFVIPMVIAFYVSLSVRHSRSHAKAVEVEQDDPALDVAIETARRGLPQFEKTLAHPGDDVVSCAVKARFVEGNHAETMWVDHLSFVNDTFTGTLTTPPIVISKIHKGDEVHIPSKDVVDWIIVHHTKDGNLNEGGETDRVLRQRLGTLRYPPRMPTSTKRLV